MGRKNKFTKEQKIKASIEYIKGKKSSCQLAHELQVSQSKVLYWAKMYKEHGEKVFDTKSINNSYTRDFKLQVINDYLEGKGSYSDLAIKYNIPADSVVNKWVSMYNKGNDIKDYNQSHEVYKMKARKTTLEEKIEIVKFCINNSNNYVLTAKTFEVPYSLVYQWVKRYEKNGESGLDYSKKGPNKKVITPTTDLEKLMYENEKLKAELKRKELELEIIKKKQYFEELIYSQKSKK